MKQTVLTAAVLLAAVSTSLRAQIYRVDVETDQPQFAGWEQSSAAATSARLSVRAFPWSPLYCDAEAYSGPSEVRLYSYCYRAAAVTNNSLATGGWIVDDVVFTGPAPNTPVPVRMAFEIFDTSGGLDGAMWHDVRVYDQTNTQVAYWNPWGPQLQPVWSVVNGPMVTPNDFYLLAPGTIVTGQPYRFDIRIRQSNGGNQGSSSNSSRVRFAAQPFVLPTGFTVNSAQANIVNNAWTPSAVPAIQPRMGTNQPITAGGTLDVNVVDGAPNVLGILAAGSDVVSPGLAFGPFAGLQISNPLTLGTFFTDGNGDWSTSFPLPASAAGLEIVLQGAIFEGTQISDIYSTNTVDVVVE